MNAFFIMHSYIVPFCSTFHITFVDSFHTDFFLHFSYAFFGGDTIDIELLKTHNTFVCISRNDFLHLFLNMFSYTFLGLTYLILLIF